MASNDRRRAAQARQAAQDGDRETLRAALQEERRGYVARGLDARVKQVDDALKRLGKEPAPKKGEQGPPAGEQQAASTRRGRGRAATAAPTQQDGAGDGNGDGDAGSTGE